MMKNILTFSSLILFFFNSCIKREEIVEDVKFSDEFLQFLVYKKNDSLVFENEAGLETKYSVIGVDKYFKKVPESVGMPTRHYYNIENQKCYLLNTLKNDTLVVIFTAKRDNQSLNVEFWGDDFFSGFYMPHNDFKKDSLMGVDLMQNDTCILRKNDGIVFLKKSRTNKILKLKKQ